MLGVREGVHNSDEVDPRWILDLIDSMMYAPRLVPIGKRFERDDKIVVMSHTGSWT